jgi:WD40 repeat protein
MVLPNGHLLSWSSDGTLQLWNAETRMPIATFRGYTGYVHEVRMLSDGRLLSWSDDGTLRLWNAQTGAPMATLAGHTDRVRGVRALPDGRLLSWSADRTLRIWDAQASAPLATLARHTDRIEGVRALPDGRLLSWSADRTLRIWDRQTGTPLATLRGYGRIGGAQILPNDRLVSWSDDGTLRLWDSKTGAPIATLRGHTRPVNGVQALPDGRLLSWSGDGTLRLWDGRTGRMIDVFGGAHTSWILGAQLLRDERLLSWSDDGTLRLWDAQTGAQLATLVGHTDEVAGVLVLPGDRLLSWSNDGTLRLWDAQTGTSLGIIHRWRKFAAEGVTAESGQGLPWVDPDPLFHRSASQSLSRRVRETTGWASAATGGVATCAGPIAPACWQSNARVEARNLFSEGIFAVTLSTGNVLCLQLHDGARLRPKPVRNTHFVLQNDRDLLLVGIGKHEALAAHHRSLIAAHHTEAVPLVGPARIQTNAIAFHLIAPQSPPSIRRRGTRRGKEIERRTRAPNPVHEAPLPHTLPDFDERTHLPRQPVFDTRAEILETFSHRFSHDTQRSCHVGHGIRPDSAVVPRRRGSLRRNWRKSISSRAAQAPRLGAAKRSYRVDLRIGDRKAATPGR